MLFEKKERISTKVHSRMLSLSHKLLYLLKSGSFSVADNRTNARPTQKLRSFFSEIATESAYRFQLSEIDEATGKFKQKIGSGGFGIVYYGKLKDGKEIAVKVLTNESFQGYREFNNEVPPCFKYFIQYILYNLRIIFVSCLVFSY